MLWSDRTVAILLAALLSCGIKIAPAAQVCPVRQNEPLHYVDVFDGSPEDLATLVPDRAHEHSGYWELGYVYKAGRFVTVRCKYADAKQVDVKLSKKINRCNYKIDAQKTLSLYCR
jgi:hypothetical protein